MTQTPLASAGQLWAPGAALGSGQQARGLGLASRKSASASAQQEDMRRRVGEFVGGVFYGTLLREVQASKLKGKYMHGGRGEEVFQSQLNVELAKKLGGATNNPIADRLFNSISDRLARASCGPSAQQEQQVSVEPAANSAVEQEQPGV